MADQAEPSTGEAGAFFQAHSGRHGLLYAYAIRVPGMVMRPQNILFDPVQPSPGTPCPKGEVREK
jgi:hypothetical protein